MEQSAATCAYNLNLFYTPLTLDNPILHRVHTLFLKYHFTDLPMLFWIDPIQPSYAPSLHSFEMRHTLLCRSRGAVQFFLGSF